MTYKSSSSFYGAVEFIGEEGKIGYIAWGFSGVFIEGCGRLIRFTRGVPVSVDVEEEVTWTLYMSDQVGDYLLPCFSTCSF